MNISKKTFNPSKPRSDQPQNSLNNNTAESFLDHENKGNDHQPKKL